MRKRVGLITLLAVLGIAWNQVQPVRGSFAAVPLEILVDEAEVIVQGKVVKIEDAKFARKFGNTERKYDAAVVEVMAVLKGPAKLKEVRIAQPAAGGLALSTDIRFAAGQEGIWLLNRGAEKDVYWALHPSQFQPAKEKENLAKLVQERDKLPAGKPADGLAARAEVVKQDKGFAVRFSLKNVSDKPLKVCDYVGNRPLQVEWIGPDGKKRESKHYDWLKAVRLRPVSEENFVTLQPGGVLFLAAQFGKDQGIRFEDAGPGEHKVTVGYVNQEDGKPFQLKDVWTGLVTAAAVVVTVK
jgi:hypothetical protein